LERTAIAADRALLALEKSNDHPNSTRNYGKQHVDQPEPTNGANWFLTDGAVHAGHLSRPLFQWHVIGTHALCVLDGNLFYRKLTLNARQVVF